MQFLSKKIIPTVLVLTSLFSYELQGSWRPYWNKLVALLWRNKGQATTLAAAMGATITEPQKEQTPQFYALPINFNPKNYAQDSQIERAVQAHWGESGKAFILIETTGKVDHTGVLGKRLRIIKTYDSSYNHQIQSEIMPLSDTGLPQEAQQHIANNCTPPGQPCDPSKIMIDVVLYKTSQTHEEAYRRWMTYLAPSETFGVSFVEPTHHLIKQATQTSPVLVQSNIPLLELLLDLQAVPRKKERSPQYWEGNLACAEAYKSQTGQPLVPLFHNWLGMKNKPQKSVYLRLLEKMGLATPRPRKKYPLSQKDSVLERLRKILSHRPIGGFKGQKEWNNFKQSD